LSRVTQCITYSQRSQQLYHFVRRTRPHVPFRSARARAANAERAANRSPTRCGRVPPRIALSSPLARLAIGSALARLALDSRSAHARLGSRSALARLGSRSRSAHPHHTAAQRQRSGSARLGSRSARLALSSRLALTRLGVCSAHGHVRSRGSASARARLGSASKEGTKFVC